MVALGYHDNARVLKSAITETKNGHPQVALELGVGEDKITWFGSLKEGQAQDITLQALLTAGFQGSSLQDLNKEPAPFNPNQKFVIKVAKETYNGKEQVKVKGIYTPKNNTFDNKLQSLQNLGALDGALMAKRQEMGVDQQAPKNYAPNANEVPF